MAAVTQLEHEPTRPVEAADDVSDVLLRTLVRALRKLGEAGQPDAANRLAASAWSGVRHQQPAIAERINGTMHYLARLPEAGDPNGKN